MIGKSFLCFVVVVIVVANAFMPARPTYQRKVNMQMQSQDGKMQEQWTRALAILTLSVGLYSAPVFAAPAPAAVATPPASVLKNVLNDYKEKSVIDPAATITPVVAPAVVKKVPPPVVKKVTPPPAAKKVSTPAPAPVPVPAPAPVVYQIKPDTELLQKLEATRKSSPAPAVPKPVGIQAAAKVVEKVKTVEKVPEKVKAVEKVPEKVKAVEKVPEKVTPAPAAVSAKPKPAPAVAVPVSTKAVVRQPVYVKPSLPEEKAVVEAFNKKSNTQAKLDQLSINVKSSKAKLLQSRADMKKYDSRMDVFDKKLEKGDLDKDLRKSLSEDRKEEEKLYNKVDIAVCVCQLHFLQIVSDWIHII